MVDVFHRLVVAKKCRDCNVSSRMEDPNGDMTLADESWHLVRSSESPL